MTPVTGVVVGCQRDLTRDACYLRALSDAKTYEFAVSVPSWRSLDWVAKGVAKEIYVRVSRITAIFRDEDRSGANITGANRAVPWREEGTG